MQMIDESNFTQSLESTLPFYVFSLYLCYHDIIFKVNDDEKEEKQSLQSQGGIPSIQILLGKMNI